MTRIMASSEDLDRLGEFLEGARLFFLTVPLGASMAYLCKFSLLEADCGRSSDVACRCVFGRPCARPLSAVCPSLEMGSAAFAYFERGGGCEMCPGRHWIARNLR